MCLFVPWVVGSINVLADQPLSLSRTTFRELPLGRPVRRKLLCKHSCPCASARGRIPQVLQRKMFARVAWMCFRLRENLSQTEGLQSWINFICMIVCQIAWSWTCSAGVCTKSTFGKGERIVCLGISVPKLRSLSTDLLIRKSGQLVASSRFRQCSRLICSARLSS